MQRRPITIYNGLNRVFIFVSTRDHVPSRPPEPNLVWVRRIFEKLDPRLRKVLLYNVSIFSEYSSHISRSDPMHDNELHKLLPVSKKSTFGDHDERGLVVGRRPSWLTTTVYEVTPGLCLYHLWS